jgi:class 3 adenylate cyclase
MDLPETRYAKTVDGVHIAYQVLGDGPPDLVFVPGWVFSVDAVWGWPQAAAALRRIAGFSRLILLDRRGTGMSDHIIPSSDQLTLESRMDDIRAVMDAAGSDRAILFGFEQGVALCAVFAATYPERTAGLVVNCYEGGPWIPEMPWRSSDREVEDYLAWVEREWGSIGFAEEEGRGIWPDLHDPRWFRDYATFMRRSASPGDAAALLQLDMDTDVRDVWPAIRVPALVVHRADDHPAAEEDRFAAERMPNADLAELPGANHGWVAPDQDEVLDEIERFVRELQREEAELDRTLATVLFTDIAGSTEKAAALGDLAWKDLVERHHSVVRSLLTRYRGQEVDTAGDGFFATFDGPARAVRCAQQIQQAIEPIGLRIRAGVHTGEVQTIDDKVGGLAVVIGSRVGAMAQAGEILVSQTVKDLVAGSGLRFEDAGEHELKGVPDRWRLYRVPPEVR